MVNGPISWTSKQQKEVVLSSAEAEYYAAGLAVQEAIWVDQLIDELKMRVNKPFVVQDDNSSAILFSDHPTDHARTKHIKRRYYFVREVVANKDLFTKPLSVTRFVQLRNLIMTDIIDE